MKKTLKMSIGIGAPTIVMIFAVISLTTLGTLSLVTANSDLALTEKTVKSVAEYYAADSKGEEFLAEVNTLMDATSKGAKGAISNFTNATYTKSKDGTTLATLIEPVNKMQSLHVEVLISSKNQATNSYYKIKTWKVINNEYWNYEDYQIPFEDEIPSNN